MIVKTVDYSKIIWPPHTGRLRIRVDGKSKIFTWWSFFTTCGHEEAFKRLFSLSFCATLKRLAGFRSIRTAAAHYIRCRYSKRLRVRADGKSEIFRVQITGGTRGERQKFSASRRNQDIGSEKEEHIIWQDDMPGTTVPAAGVRRKRVRRLRTVYGWKP